MWAPSRSRPRHRPEPVLQAPDAGASAGKKDAATTGKYRKGMAVFTIVKGGAMYEASVGGQKFKYKPLSAAR